VTGVQTCALPICKLLGFIAVIGIGLLVVYYTLGGSLSAREPTKPLPRPKVPDAHDVNAAGHGVVDVGRTGSDQVAQLDPTIWRVIVPLVIAVIVVMYVWRKFPNLRWIVLGAGVAVLVISALAGR